MPVRDDGCYQKIKQKPEKPKPSPRERSLGTFDRRQKHADRRYQQIQNMKNQWHAESISGLSAVVDDVVSTTGHHTALRQSQAAKTAYILPGCSRPLLR